MTIDMIDILIKNLRGVWKEGEHFYMAKEEVREILTKNVTVDFGFDADAWEKWYREVERGEHYDQISFGTLPPLTDADKPQLD